MAESGNAFLMEFIRLNYRKFIGIFLLCVFSGVLFVGFLYFMRRSKMDPAEYQDFLTLGPLLFAGFTLVWFLVIVLAGMYQYCMAKKILSILISMKIFDHDLFGYQHSNENSWLNFTRTILSGESNSYPVQIALDYGVFNSGRTNVIISVSIIKFEHDYKERFLSPLNWRGRLAPDLRERFLDFITRLHEKGYEKSDLRTSGFLND